MTSFYDGKRVLVTGGHGFLGVHLVRKLREHGARVVAPTRYNLDMCDVNSLDNFYYDRMSGGIVDRFHVIFHLAAKVGGIHYNLTHAYDLIWHNTMMALGAIYLARAFGGKLVCAGSVCAYPKNVPVPAIEENLYEGYPEESNGPYGNAKRILLEAQRAAWSQHAVPSVHLVSANLYGPGDNFDPKSSHVIPALIVKVQDAIDAGDPEIIVWGTGKASRDFLYVEDAADAYLAAGEFIDVPPQPINIASNEEVPIHYLVTKLVQIMGYDGSIVYDDTKPDGQPRRSFVTRKMKELTGWQASTSLDVGLEKTVEWYRAKFSKPKKG